MQLDNCQGLQHADTQHSCSSIAYAWLLSCQHVFKIMASSSLIEVVRDLPYLIDLGFTFDVDSIHLVASYTTSFSIGLQ